MRSSRLPCLVLVTFVAGTDNFVMAGVLPAVAADLAVTEAAAGQLVTVFSIAYALAAPAMVAATARLDRRTLLATGLAVFALLNAAAALAPSYTALLVVRLLAAVVAAAMTPAAFAAAAALAPPERVGRAIGSVAAGMTVALVVGVPLGTWLGAASGWRSTFWLVAGFAVAGCGAVVASLPALPASGGAGLARRVRLLAAPPVLLAVVATAVAATGSFMTYTYVAPIARDLAGAGADVVALLIACVGVAGALGTVLGGRATDRWGAGRTLVLALAVQVAATAVLVAAGLLGGVAALPVIALGYAVWGLAGWAFNPPMNARLLRLAGDAGTEAVALNSSALFVGIAAGGALGGVVLEAEGVPAVLLTAIAIGSVALVLLAVSVVRHRTGQPRADLAAVGEDRNG